MQTNDIARAIGSKVRASRKEIGLTRKQLAASAAVSERYLHELENGEANATVGILVKIAGALGQDFASLVTPESLVALEHIDVRPAFAGSDYAGLSALIASMSRPEQTGARPIIEQYLRERRRSCRGIALLGLRGAGKSTLGRRLAERYGLPFISVTREIEARAGMSLADLFNLGGPDAYRSLENDVIVELTKRDGHIVLETAGGIVGNSEALAMILATFKTVWLKAAPEEHLARVAGQGDTRPVLGNPKALDHLKALLALREPDYARAEVVVDTSGRTSDACLAELEQIAATVLAAHAA